MTSPQPPDPRFPVWDPHPHPLDLLACWLVPALGTRTGVPRPVSASPNRRHRCDRTSH